jgi:hypothetical protein
MIGVGVAYKYRGYLFPAKIQPAQAYLRPLSPVKQKKLSFAAQ